MTPKEKSNELIEKYSEYVSGYIGSSMLTNTEYPEMIIKNAKNCALICVNEILDIDVWFSKNMVKNNEWNPNECKEFWIEVKQEIEKL